MKRTGGGFAGLITPRGGSRPPVKKKQLKKPKKVGNTSARHDTNSDLEKIYGQDIEDFLNQSDWDMESIMPPSQNMGR